MFMLKLYALGLNNMTEWDGEERRQKPLEKRVRDLEECDRAAKKSRESMHIQLGKVEFQVSEGRKEVQTALKIITDKWDLHVESCPRKDIGWLKQWLIWIGAGEVGIAAFMTTWIINHVSKGK